jgi:hypothetical protein
MILNAKERGVIESLIERIRSTTEQNDEATRRARHAIIELANPESIVHFASDVADALKDRGIPCPALIAFVEKPTFNNPRVKPVLAELAALLDDSRA